MTIKEKVKDTDPKIALLSALTEEQLRVQLLVPLLRQMGLVNVKEYHGGSSEKGKDIVGHYTDLLGARHHVAVVVKRGDIHGAVGKPSNASEVLYQVEQALSEPFSDVYSLEPIDITECWVVTSGLIKNTAIESIRGKLSKSNLDKVTRFIDQEKLTTLIDKHWPDYWMHDRIMISLAHDMRAPIAAAKSQALFIARHPGKVSDEVSRRRALDIASEMDLLGHLVEFMYMANRQTINLHVEEIDIQNEVNKVVRMLQSSKAEVSIRVMLTEIPRLRVDPDAFRQCIFNLVRNALQYSTGFKEQIEISGALIGDNALIKVKNFGIGVPEGWEDLIFEQGVRAPNASSTAGPGTGLVSCQLDKVG